MSKRDLIRDEIKSLFAEGQKLASEFRENKEKQFQYDYQKWYTKALKVVYSLAPDRHDEFRAYYEIDPKRKTLGYGTYVIQDYFKNVIPNQYQHPDFDTRRQVLICVFNQITIFNSIIDRLDFVLSDIEGELYTELQESEILIAKKLSTINLRAAVPWSVWSSRDTYKKS